jgi:hypothetical protein
MFRAGITRLSLAALAALVAFGGVDAARVGGGSGTLAALFSHLAAVDATTLASALPLRMAPRFEPGLRLVALVVSDIDADGDLDLVANDGSLDLLVWINDGAGQLTRRYARQSSGWREDRSTATDDRGHATAWAATSAGVLLGLGESVAVSPRPRGGRGISFERRHPDSLFSRSQNPRGPPTPTSSL